MRPVALDRLAWIVLLCALIGPTGATGAVTPAQTCAAAKLKAAGNEIAGEMSCYAKAKKAGVGVDGGCLSRQRMKADTRINKADGACSGTAAAVDNCVAAFLNDDPGNGACPAASASKIGRGAKVELGCRAKDVLRPGIFAACDEKADSKTGAALEKAGGCVNPTAVLADIDNCGPAVDATSCPGSLCAPESPEDSCPTPPHHLGPGDVCVDRGSCDQSDCSSDGDCGSGKVCLRYGIPVPFGCNGGSRSLCCPPCASYSCLISPAPVCGGTCPSGQICGQATGGGSCECVPSNDTCAVSQAPTCGGTCPDRLCCAGGQVCGQTSDGNSCACVCTLACPFVTTWGSAGTGDGQFSGPLAIALGGGNVFVLDSNSRIQKFDNTGTFLTKWGSAGTGDGQFQYPGGVAVDGSGAVFVADSGNDRIQKFDNTGAFLTKWGTLGVGDGQFHHPQRVAVDRSGNVFVTDTSSGGNDRIQKFTNTGTFLAQWGSTGSGDGQFAGPTGIAVDRTGNVFVADLNNRRIQKFDNTGTFLTKWGSAGDGDGQFDAAIDVGVDGNGNVFVADFFENRIQKFDNNGTFLTKWGCPGSGDGQFQRPFGVAVDGSGNVFVADSDNNRIQKFACP
jgi:DNA-binding beta-propeller fold protein YncE